MATLQIKMADSKFISHNGINVEIFEENYVKGNGWEARIDPNGKLECVASTYYQGELHLIKLKIHKGFIKLIMKIGREKGVLLKSCRLETAWPVDGIVGLPGGYIDTRRPYFRTNKFQNFLNEHEITSVRHESANGTYMLITEREDGEVFYYEELETDGNSELVLNDAENGICRYEVTNATWSIKTIKERTKKRKILYTTDNPERIMNLPKA